MINVLSRTAALLIALTAPVLAQQSLVNFSAASYGLPDATNSPQDAASTSEERWNFDLSSSLFAGYHPVFGGVRVTNSSNLVNNAATYLKISTNTSTSTWPNGAKMFVFSTADSSTAASTVDVAFLWKRADFLTTGARVAFQANSTLSVNITDWSGTSAVPGQIRFLVKNGSTYYVSEASRGGSGTLSLTDFNNTSTVGKRWAVIAPSGNTLALPNSGLTFAAVNFDDVQAVGWIGRGARAYATLYGFSSFQATGSVRTSAMILSTNLAKMRDHNSVPVFLNVIKSMSPWFSTQHPGQWGTGLSVPLDSAGWPNGIPIVDGGGGQHAAMSVLTNAMIPGQYRLRFKGTGRFEIQDSGGNDSFDATRIAGLPVDADGYRTTLTRSMPLRNAREGGFIRLIIRESYDNPSTSARENLHDFELIEPGYTAQQAQTQLFNAAYVSQSSMYHTIRYMDWGMTNGHGASEWNQRTLPKAFTQSVGGGVAIEYMVAFSNATGTNMWYCLPHKASDDYVLKAAQLIRHGAKADGTPFNPAVDPVSARVWPGLNSNLKVYVEYSNETWNSLFNQTQYVIDQGTLLGGQGLPMLTGQTAGNRYTSYRSAQIWQKFYDVFGTDAPKRVVRVLGSQIDPDVSRTRLDAFKVPGLITNGQYPDALATAPYFGGSVPNDIYNAGLMNTITVSEILARAQTAVNNLATNLTETRDLAKEFGVRFINYEGGQHMVGTDGVQDQSTLTNKIVAANRDPGMKAVYASYMSLLNSKGIQEHAHFVDIQPASGKYGCWGAQEYFGEPLSAAGKADAIAQFVQNNPKNNQAPLARYTASGLLDTDGNGSQAVTLNASSSRDLETSIVEYIWRFGTTRYSGSTLTITAPVGITSGTLTLVDTDGAVSVTPVEFSVLPKGSDVTVYRSDFSGTAPALNTPWTKTSVLNAALTQGGWTLGVRPSSDSIGVMGGVNVNNKFCVDMRGTSDEANPVTLAQALSVNSYLSLKIRPVSGKVLDLRGATLKFDFELSQSSARRFAVMTSVGGFTEAAALYNSPVTLRMGLESFTLQVPATPAYGNLTGEVEIRLYCYHNNHAAKAFSLLGFDLKSAVR